MPVTESKFVEAYRARHQVQAHAIRLALEDAGIRVVIENEALQDGIGDIPCGWSSSPRLLVEESQLAAAREFISRTDHSASADLSLTFAEAAGIPLACLGIGLGELPDSGLAETTRCLACGTIMSETETVCPSCGWTYEAGSPSDSE